MTRGATRLDFRWLLKPAWSGVAWIALGGMLGGCSGGGTAVTSNGGGPGPVPESAFAINFSTNKVVVFTVNTTVGTWTAVGGAATGTGPRALAVHPSGKFLYVANATSKNISVYTIDSQTAALTPILASPIATTNIPYALTIDFGGSFLYVATTTATLPPVNTLIGYKIDATTGSLTLIMQPAVSTTTTSVGLTFNPSSEFLYAADAGNDVTAFMALTPSGVLTRLPSSGILAGAAPVGIAALPNGKFIYVTNSLSNNVSGYKVDALTGDLTPVPMSPFTSGTTPSSTPSLIVAEPSGKYVYVLNSGEGDISEYSSSPTGVLIPLPSARFVLAPGPTATAMAADPTGNFLFVVNGNAINVAILMIQKNGTLTSLGTMINGAGSTAVAFRAGHL